MVTHLVEDGAGKKIVGADGWVFPGDVLPAEPVADLGIGGEEEDFAAVDEFDC